MIHELTPRTWQPAADGYAAPPQPTVVDVIRVIRRRVWVILLILITATVTAVVLTHRMIPVWRSHAQLGLVQPSSLAVNLSGNQMQSDPSTQETPDTQMTMLQDQEMARRALNLLSSRLGPQQPLPVTADQLMADISVNNPHNTDLIDLYVDANNPQVASQLAGAVTDAFIAWKKEVAQQNSEDSLASLELRADRAQASLNVAEQQELQFKQAHHVIDAPSQSAALIAQSSAADAAVQALQQDLSTEQVQLNGLGQHLSGVDKALQQGIGVRDDSLAVSLQSQLSQLEIERADEALKVTAKYPGILPDLDAKIKDIQNRMTTAIRATLNNKMPSLASQSALAQSDEDAQLALLVTKAKLQAALQTQAHLHQETANLPAFDLTAAHLASNADLARSLYNSLQQGLNVARMEKDMVTGNVQLVQPADLPDKPESPILWHNLLAGLGIGIALSVFAVMLLEQMDRRVRSVDGLRLSVDGPVIGALPQMAWAQMTALRKGDLPLPVVESFNLTSIGIELLHRQMDVEQEDADGAGDRSAAGVLALPKGHVIMVTSALPGEGKSLTAALLARSMAVRSRRVVLVNADMRRPTQQDMFPPKAGVGLSDVLSGRVPLVDALEHSDTEGLLVLHSGSPTDSPSRLLSGRSLSEMLGELRAAQCTVIVDTPACAVVGDALMVAPHADSVLHVVGAGIVDVDQVQQTAATLRSAGRARLAYFVNRAQRGLHAQYQYRNHYTRPTEAEMNGATPMALADDRVAEPTRPLSSLWANTEPQDR